MTFISYAQNLEDVIIWRALKHVGPGFYIDVGAWSPDVDSVTRAFYDHGWAGINVEPDPDWHRKLVDARPRDINLRAAVSTRDGEGLFYVMSNPGLSTLDAAVQAQHLAHGLTGTTIETPTLRLETIWREHVGARDVHFLKIDVEGHEASVIASNDWRRGRPWLVVVEATRPMSTDESHDEWEPTLVAADYVFAYADGLNRYYVAREHDEILPAFRYPPNVFDDYRLAVIGQLEVELAESKGRELGALEIVEATKSEAKALTEHARELDAVARRHLEIAQSHEERALRAEATIERYEAAIQQYETSIERSKNAIQRYEMAIQRYETFVGKIKLLLDSPLWRRVIVLIGRVERLLQSERKAVLDLLHVPEPYSRLERIDVDLTPLLPGGVNGGAKIFVIALLQALARAHPNVHFTLLTRIESHDEIAYLDAPNVSRRLTLDPTGTAAPSTSPSAAPPRRASRWRRRLKRLFAGATDRGGLAQAPSAPAAQLLFCPFTAPFYAKPGVPVVSTLHDLQYKTYPEFFDPADVAQRDKTFRDACHWSSAIVAVSEYSRQTALAASRLPGERIHTVHIRAAHRMAEVPAEMHAEVLGRHGLSPRRYILYPANFWRHKNHELLLIAFAMACRDALPPDITLVCTGVLSDRGSWLKSELDRLGLAGRVLMPGFVATDELAVFLRNAAGLVFPSLYEGFGMPVIEAFAAGVPVACSNTTSLPEVAGDAAYLFDPRVPTQIAKGLAWLASDAPRAEGFVERGRAAAAAFADSNRMAGEYWTVMEAAFHHGAIQQA